MIYQEKLDSGCSNARAGLRSRWSIYYCNPTADLKFMKQERILFEEAFDCGKLRNKWG
jgi:hypothetical protein